MTITLSIIIFILVIMVISLGSQLSDSEIEKENNIRIEEFRKNARRRNQAEEHSKLVKDVERMKAQLEAVIAGTAEYTLRNVINNTEERIKCILSTIEKEELLDKGYSECDVEKFQSTRDPKDLITNTGFVSEEDVHVVDLSKKKAKRSSRSRSKKGSIKTGATE